MSTRPPEAPPTADSSTPRARFADTRWSVVLRAGRNDTPNAP